MYMHMYIHVLGVLCSIQCFVLAVTMLRELYDDFKRFLRDMEVNAQKFNKLTPQGLITAQVLIHILVLRGVIEYAVIMALIST